eukprot:14827347-Alexandrium_andersonii.AAC.1
MSASLVGSEMCIRDRPRTSQKRANPNCHNVNDNAFTSCVRGKRTERAVSYTHLTLPTICSV